MASKTQMKIKGLETILTQYDFIEILEEYGDVKHNQYYVAQVEQLRGMREIFEDIFGCAPYTKLEAQAMLHELIFR